MMKQFLQNRFVILILILSVNSLVAQDLFTNGVIEYNNKNYKEAAGQFENFIASNPFEVAPYEYLVNCYIELGENNKAIELLEISTKKFSNNSNLVKTLGKLYVNNYNFEKAENSFIDALKLEPKKSEIIGYLAKINVNMAKIAFQQKDFRKAISKANKALQYDDKDYEAYILKSNAQIQMGNLQDAEKTIDAGLLKNPNNDQLLVDKSLLQINQEKYDEAINSLSPVWKRNTDNLQIGLQLGRLYRGKNKIIEAFAIYDILLKNNPKERTVYDEMLYYFSATGKESEKRKIYDKMEKEFPGDKEIILAKFKTYVNEGQDSLAIIMYSDFISSNPKSYKAYAELAELYSKKEMPEEGIILMNKALSNNLKEKSVYFNLAKFYHKSNKLEIALKTYKEYSELYPKDISTYYEIGLIYSEINNLDLAKLSFNKALDIDQNDALSLAQISRIFELTGDNESAKKYYVDAFIQNIIALQKMQQSIISSINETDNLSNIKVDKNVDNVKLYQDNVNEAENYLVKNLSNSEYLEMINRVRSRYPQSSLVLYYIGLYYERIGDYNSSLKYYEQVISRSSKVEDAHTHMAEIFYKKGEKAKAILSYKRALSINQENKEIYKKLIELHREDNILDKLCDEWLNVYSAQPHNKLLKEFLIVALHKANRIAEAKEILNNRE
ncbi:MAG: tetratricopeptide repeat protein [Bacteroidetes bacterium]|nr:tetratricopeptide repeat protein [Bacteroidota bacterium]MBU1117022.1 tetratricopeptide repeat protein [Bacteroidota bacterium]MBU1797617.1 tetratricopeptide repeat protein [Bacteroidota bacterium]